MTNLLLSGNIKQSNGPISDHQTGQQLHVSGVFIVLLELALTLENLLPVCVVVFWLPSRGVGDRLVAAFSIVCILSAVVPAPLGLVSYFSGGWYGGNTTCTTYQVTSLWCNLSSLALLTCICVHCNVAIRHLNKLSTADRRHINPLISSASTSSSHTPKPKTPGPSHKPEYVRVKCSDHPDTDLSSELQLHRGEDIPAKNIASCEQNTQQKISEDVLEDYTSMSNLEVSGEVQTKATMEIHQTKTNYTKGSKSHGATNELTPEFPCSLLKHECALNLPIKDSSHGPNDDSRSAVVYRDTAVSISRADCSLGYSRMDNGHGVTTLNKTSWFKTCRSRDYVTLGLFFLCFLTMSIASLPMVGLGPSHDQSQTSCRSWLVPVPAQTEEKVFYIVFILFLSVCLVTGCWAGACVCLHVSNRMKMERRRKSRLYHEEENVPDLEELSILEVIKRHYSLACIVMAGQLTWVPLLLMMILQKSGVGVSEATLMYSNIVTSLPGLLNPLLYSLALSNYRDGYKAILNKCCCRTQKKGGKNVSKLAPGDDHCVDVAVNVSQDGHVCLHGRPNPCCGHSTSSAEEVEEDEDDFPESLMEPAFRETTWTEKTPLQDSSESVQSQLMNSARLGWCRPQDRSQSTEYLLATVDHDGETRL